MQMPIRPALPVPLVSAIVVAGLLLAAIAQATPFDIDKWTEGPAVGTLEWGITQANASPDQEHSLLFAQSLASRALLLTSALPSIDVGSAGKLELQAGSAPGFSLVKNDPDDEFDILHVVSGQASIIELDISGGDFRIDQDAKLAFQYEEAFEIEDDILGDGKLIKQGAGQLTLSGINAYTGGSDVLEGELLGDTLSLQGDIDLAQDTGLIFEFSNTDSDSSTKLYAGVITGAGKLYKRGDGTLQISGDASHTGGTQIEQGKLVASAADLSGAVEVHSGATFQLHQGLDGEYADAISGAGGVRKSGAGTLTLSGANSFTGGLAVADDVVVGSTSSIPGDVELVTATSQLTFDQTVAGTHAGDITGLGQLLKSGAGTLTLTGSSSYSGGTTITTGTLRGDSVSLQGVITVQGGALLELSHTSNQTFSGTTAGTGGLVKSGAGTLTLNNTLGHTGETRIDEGTLQLQVDLPGPLDIEPGGRLLSGQTIGGELVVDGRVAVPGKGTLSVGGNATFGAGAWYELTVDAAGNSSAIAVTGTATLNGGSLFVEIEPGDYSAPGQTYTILSSASLSPVVDFAVPTPPDPAAHAFASLTPGTAGNAVTLTVEENTNAAESYARTPNQRATAVALDELLLSGAGQSDIDAIRFSRIALRVSEVPDWLNALAADTLSSFANTRLSNARHFARALTRRFTATRFERGQAPPRRRTTATSSVSAGSEPLSFEPARGERGLGGWLEPFGVFSDLDGEGRASSLSTRVYGVTSGGDYRLLFPDSRSLRLGVGVGYTRSSVRSTADRMLGWGHTYQSALYAAFAAPRFHVGLAGRYAYSDLWSKRSIRFGDIDTNALGRFSGHEGSGLFEAGLHLGDPRVALFHPTAGLLYTHLTQQAFAETGAGSLSLEIGAMEIDSVVTTLGTRIARVMTLQGDYGVEPELRLAWNHEFGDRGRPVRARFSGAVAGGRFANAGSERRRDDFTLGFGYVMRIGDIPLLSTHYDVRLSQAETEHSISLGLYLHW